MDGESANNLMQSISLMAPVAGIQPPRKPTRQVTSDSIPCSIVTSPSLVSPMGILPPNKPMRQTTVDSTLTATVPVPAALPLFASALVGLGLLSRRRRSA